MAGASQNRAYALLADARLAAAAWAAGGDGPESRRFAAGLFALAGDERGVAEAIDPELLIEVARNVDSRQKHGAAWFDHAAAAVAGSLAGDESATMESWRAACEAADVAGVAAASVAARERLSHHALLFGDLAAARGACDEAIRLAAFHGLPGWRLACEASAAGLSLAAGDVTRAAERLADPGVRTPDTELHALFAPVAVQLALASGDHEAVTAWTGPAMLGVATHGFEPRPATAAVSACVQALGGAPAGSMHAAALRRALLRCDAGEAADLLSLAARFGDAEDAGFAVERLRATFAPERPYVNAHYLLARAHWCSRFGKRADAVDSAGDAARAFDAIGLRNWTDEAMSLLVHDDAPDGMPQRRRPTAFSLTGREQQVAHLIRRGASNREVARTLQISEHTVERHVSSILSRLGLRSRWQIVDIKTAVEEGP